MAKVVRTIDYRLRENYTPSSPHRLKSFMRQLQANGLIEPLIVTKDNTISQIDLHHEPYFEACVLMEWDTIIVVTEEEIQNDEWFSG